jgi:cystathionine beta-lyase
MTKTWQTKLIHSDAKIPTGYKSLATPTYRESTTVFLGWSAKRHLGPAQSRLHVWLFYGTPTAMELAARICELESGKHTILAPADRRRFRSLILHCFRRGTTSCSLPAFTIRIASHRTTALALRVLRPLPYDPLVGAGISALMQENTRLAWTESPGSITMEVQDIPHLSAAQARNVKVVIDNTWSAGAFRCLAHGVDITMQAVTKYIGGTATSAAWLGHCTR